MKEIRCLLSVLCVQKRFFKQPLGGVMMNFEGDIFISFETASGFTLLTPKFNYF